MIYYQGKYRIPFMKKTDDGKPHPVDFIKGNKEYSLSYLENFTKNVWQIDCPSHGSYAITFNPDFSKSHWNIGSLSKSTGEWDFDKTSDILYINDEDFYVDSPLRNYYGDSWYQRSINFHQPAKSNVSGTQTIVRSYDNLTDSRITFNSLSLKAKSQCPYPYWAYVSFKITNATDIGNNIGIAITAQNTLRFNTNQGFPSSSQLIVPIVFVKENPGTDYIAFDFYGTPDRIAGPAYVGTEGFGWKPDDDNLSYVWSQNDDVNALWDDKDYSEQASSRSFDITKTKMIAGGVEIPSYIKNCPSYYVLVGLPIMATPKDDFSEGCNILTSKLNIEFYTYD